MVRAVLTVLAKYQRLEAEGIWRPAPEAQRRDVIVSIGDATLVLSDMNGSALTHWSLPALHRLNPGKRPALFAPGEDAPETLEIADAEMVDAIGKVLKAINRHRARPGRIRGATLATMVLGGLVLGALWLPGAVAGYTASIIPDAARNSLGRDLLSKVTRLAGAPCADPHGANALERIKTRLLGERTQLHVLPSALRETAHLPGGHILISHTLVEDFETPDVLAGYILAEDVRRTINDPAKTLLENAGLFATITMLTTGKLPDSALEKHAETLVGALPGPVPDDLLLQRMDAAGVPSAPYAFARDISGETTLPLIEAASTTGDIPVLSDGNWIALQKICEG